MIVENKLSCLVKPNGERAKLHKGRIMATYSLIKGIMLNALVLKMRILKNNWSFSSW
jgi:hypothetical protein